MGEQSGALEQAEEGAGLKEIVKRQLWLETGLCKALPTETYLSHVRKIGYTRNMNENVGLALLRTEFPKIMGLAIKDWRDGHADGGSDVRLLALPVSGSALCHLVPASG